jgi:hypothetical protein
VTFGALMAWMKLGRLFPLPLSPSTVAAGGRLERVFGAVPPPRFRMLRYDSSRPRVPGQRWLETTETVRLVENAGWRSMVWEGRTVRGYPPRPGSHTVGPVGLFKAATASAGSGGWLSQPPMDRVRAVRDVKGSLFPLAPGRRVSFSADRVNEGWLGPLRIRQRATSQDAYEVTGTTDRWPSVPGTVFVIIHTMSVQIPSLGWDVSGREELHYAPALGAVVFRRGEKQDLNGNPWVDEERLVEWR